MEEKHCPFMNVRDVIFECYQERCALWINGRCAVVAIAENLTRNNRNNKFGDICDTLKKKGSNFNDTEPTENQSDTP